MDERGCGCEACGRPWEAVGSVLLMATEAEAGPLREALRDAKSAIRWPPRDVYVGEIDRRSGHRRAAPVPAVRWSWV